MFCKECGVSIPESAKFCPSCGVSQSSQSENHPTNVSSIQVVPKVRPWIRYWARMFDIYAFSIVVGIFLGFVAPVFLVTTNEYVLGMLIVFVWIFFEAFLLSTFQTTPGKWLFKTKISTDSGDLINFSHALTRSFKVWWRGLGTGFPFATLATLIIAHKNLSRDGSVSWDKEGKFVVTHDALGTVRIAVLLGCLLIFFLLIALGSK